MRDYKLTPTIICSDFMNVGRDIDELTANGVDYIHVDIMDGHFVPNLTLGTGFCAAARKYAKVPLDIHLMVERPELLIPAFDPQPGEIVTVHYEATYHLQRVLTTIRAAGAKAAVALNIATPVNVVEHVLPDIDQVLIMTVNPGYAGQALVPQTIAKIKAMREFLDTRGYTNMPIQVDGNVSMANCAEMYNAGARVFVTGSYSAFIKGRTITESLTELRGILDNC